MAAAADERTPVSVGERSVPLEIYAPADGPGPHPAVLVICESFGLNDDIRRISRRFADNGYLAAAPDLLTGDLHIRCVLRAMSALRKGRGQAVDDLEATIAALQARPDVATVGAAGFCMGGGFALLLGCRRKVAAAGVFYADIRGRDDLAQTCPLVGGYGGKDRTIGPHGRRLIAALDDLGIEHDIRMYDDAGHSYMNRAGKPILAALSRPFLRVEYNEQAAEDSWRRMLEFFGRHLAVAA
jgi:carboxymethylenebutenolidase